MYNSFISWSYLIKLEVFKLEKEIIIIKDDRKTIFPCARHKLHLILFLRVSNYLIISARS